MERFEARQLANYLGVSLSCVYKLTQNNKIPHFRFGTKILYRKDAIDAWIKTQEQANISKKMEVR